MGPHELLEKVATVFERLGIPYLVTGSVASIAYGEPRMTNDIDIVAGIAPEHIPGLLDAFPAGEYFISADMIREAITRGDQFNIIHPASGLKIDVFVGGESPFDMSRFGRSRRIQTAPGRQVTFASPEDVIIKKMAYYREGGSEKHLRDITGILATAGGEIDTAYIAAWAERLGLGGVWAAVQERMRERG